jgi:hypothetical protein
MPKAMQTAQATHKSPGKRTKNELSPEQREELLMVLKSRFEKNMGRHKGVAWTAVRSRLDAAPGKLWSLHEMERTGGEPDVVGRDEKTGELIFHDCSAESPDGRRSFATTGKRSTHGKSTSRRIVQSTWQWRWGSNC